MEIEIENAVEETDLRDAETIALTNHLRHTRVPEIVAPAKSQVEFNASGEPLPAGIGETITALRDAQAMPVVTAADKQIRAHKITRITAHLAALGHGPTPPRVLLNHSRNDSPAGQQRAATLAQLAATFPLVGEHHAGVELVSITTKLAGFFAGNTPPAATGSALADLSARVASIHADVAKIQSIEAEIATLRNAPEVAALARVQAEIANVEAQLRTSCKAMALDVSADATPAAMIQAMQASVRSTLSKLQVDPAKVPGACVPANRIPR